MREWRREGEMVEEGGEMVKEGGGDGGGGGGMVEEGGVYVELECCQNRSPGWCPNIL